MDPFTLLALGSAAPALISMFQPQPGMPTPPQVQLPANMMGYENQMLGDAFNPNSNLLSIALDKANGGLMRMMANQGIGNSSYANRALSAQDNDITNQWIQNATARQTGAVNALSNFLPASTGAANTAFQDAFTAYLQSLKNGGALNNNISSMMGGISSPLMMGYMNNQNQTNFNNLLSAFGGQSQSGYNSNSGSYSGSPTDPLALMSPGGG